MMLKWKKTALIAGVSLLVLSVPLAVSAGTDKADPGKSPKTYQSQSGVNDVASLLGKTSDEIRQERLNGNSMAQIVTKQGQPKEQVLESFLTKRKEALADRVAQGWMMQEQADLCLSQMKERVSANWERTETGKPDNAPSANQGMGGKGHGVMGHSGKGQGHGMGNGAGRGQ